MRFSVSLAKESSPPVFLSISSHKIYYVKSKKLRKVHQVLLFMLLKVKHLWQGKA